MSQISQRYAEAFYEAAEALGKQDACLADLLTCSEVLSAGSSFLDYLLNPKATLSEKQQRIREVFHGEVEDLTQNLLLLMLQKGRITLVPEVLNDYQAIHDSRKNVIRMKITTAYEAEPELIDRIAEKFRKQYDAESVQVDVDVDPDLIGGAIIVIGDTMYDESVRGKLQALETEINAE